MKKKRPSKDVHEMVANTVISPDVQIEYVSYHDNFTGDIAFPKEQIAEKGRLLVMKKTPLQDKKRILFRLAHTAVLSAHHAVDRYLRQVDESLLAWTVIAWRESRERVLDVGMEEVFGDSFQAEPFVMSGLGGDKEGRLRACPISFPLLCLL